VYYIVIQEIAMDSILSVRLPADLRKRLQAASRAEGKPVSDLIRDFIRKELDVIEFRRLREATLPYAGAKGIYTDEDVYKLIS
jgi:metal-responsive CopG/Arc/MetJ family transcriptional regulator